MVQYSLLILLVVYLSQKISAIKVDLSGERILPTGVHFASRFFAPDRKTKLGGSTFNHLFYSKSSETEWQKYRYLSSPEDCSRNCKEDEPPRTCYYKFTLEMYTTLGNPCKLCTPNATNTLKAECQCVPADGVEKGILVINRMLPGPSIEVCEGDKVVVDVNNQIEGMEVTLHWHGIFQKGTQYYDGAPYVTQCPIQQGNRFRYQWIANYGTHFYHSHSGLQKIDGLQGSILVRQAPSRDPNSHLYDHDLSEHVIFIADYLHQGSEQRFPGRLDLLRQSPDNILINGKGQYRNPKTKKVTTTPLEVFTVAHGGRYRFRLINSFATVCPAQLTIEGHDLTIIASDGEPVKQVVVNTIISFSGERYDFVVYANKPSGLYWIQVRGLGECGINRIQQLAILKYENCPQKHKLKPPSYDYGLEQGIVLNPLDARCHENRNDAICVSQLFNAKEVDPGILSKNADFKIFLPFRFHRYTSEALYKPNTYQKHLVIAENRSVLSLIDEISYMSPPAPLISQYDDNNPEQYCNSDEIPEKCGEPCMCTHKIEIPLNAVVEIVLVDEVQQANLSHPFHLHGYTFSVIGIGRYSENNVDKISLKKTLDMERRGMLYRQYNRPPSKDTVAVPNNGYVVLRFRADNPGFWLFHCHFLFHVAIGMNVVLQVGTTKDLPPVPEGFPTCGDHLPPIS
nr:multicopper oxidase 2 [Henosepilachna vigintioctopunctata]